MLLGTVAVLEPNKNAPPQYAKCGGFGMRDIRAIVERAHLLAAYLTLTCCEIDLLNRSGKARTRRSRSIL